MKTRILSIAFLVLIAASCQQNMEEPAQQIDNTFKLFAVQDNGTDSKTVISGEGSVYWDPAEEIKVFKSDGSGFLFKSSNSEPVASAVFSGVLSKDDVEEGEELWAVYPFAEEATFDGETITTVLPSEQVARAESFGRNMNLSIAKTTSTKLRFYNVGGGIRFTITQEGVNKVVFEGLNGEIISGKVTVGFEEDVPVVKEVTGGSQFITLLPPEGETFQKDKWYYIVAIPGALSGGYKLRFYKAEDYAKKVSETPVTIKRGIFGSVDKADKENEYESTTSSFPETKEEIIQSFEITQNLAEEINTIIERKRGEIEGFVPDAQVIADQIASMENIISAKPNSSGKMIDVVQRDGARFSVILEREGIVYDEEENTNEISYFISSHANTGFDVTRSSIVPLGDKKALLLAPYQHGYVYRKTNERGKVIEEKQMGNTLVDANYVRGLLNSAGYSLRYLEDDKVGIQHFYGDSLSKYDLIILLTHGGENGWIGVGHVDPVSFIDKYGDSFQEGVHYYRFIDNGYVEIGVSSEWFEETTKTNYPNSIVYFGACHSYEDTSFNNYFHRHNAKAYAGFKGVAYFKESGTMNQPRDIMYCLLRSLCFGMSFSQAVNHIHDYSDIWTFDFKTFCFFNPYTFNNTTEEDVFLVDPHPFDLNPIVNNNIVTLIWKNPQTAGTYRYRAKVSKGNDFEKWYDSQTLRGVTISDLEPGTYSWSVQADLYYDGNLFESYTTEGEPFTIDQPKIDKPVISINPGSLPYDDTAIGTTAELNVAIINSGNAQLDIYSVSCPEGFSTSYDSWSNKWVKPNDQRYLRVYFNPTVAKSYSGDIVIKSNASNQSTLSFSVKGKGVSPAQASISINPSSLTFGDTNEGDSRERKITITNNGKAYAVISVIACPTGFSSSFGSWQNRVIEPNESKELTIYFKPTSVKAYSGEIVINPNTQNSASISVSGKCVKAKGPYDGALVDLGLSVKWASHNLGASVPEAYGDYYAWGETEPLGEDYDYFSWSGYKFYVSGDDYKNVVFSKYVRESVHGKVDNKSVLDPEDDAATVRLGKGWRMPTEADIHELIENCDYKWTTLNGVSGTKISSKVLGYVGNWIFVPASGRRYHISFLGTAFECWSSSFYFKQWYDITDSTRAVAFVGSSDSPCGWNDEGRNIGLAIRPVFKK